MNTRFTVLLSASVPAKERSKKFQEEYTKIKNAQIQIDEAVIGLSRNIFQAGGKLIFGGHPTISPLVSMVATEFKMNMNIEDKKRNEQNEKAINIFQSKAYEAVIPKETNHLFRMGYSDIIWTDSKNGEEFNPKIKKTAQCVTSLEFMRREMMKGEIDAMVCIGGMEGVELEFELFRELHPKKLIFILQTTGGASKILAKKFSNSKMVRVIDNKDYSKIREEKNEDNYFDKFEIIPYAFISALIVKEIINNKKL